MVKSGLPVRYKNGDKSNYVRRGPNYHIPLRNPCEQKNPTDPLKRPLFPLLHRILLTRFIYSRLLAEKSKWRKQLHRRRK